MFETIVPGKYPGRTRHYHVKVQAPGRNILTTQLYFPGEPGNEGDRIFDPALLLDIPLGRGPNLARYDFVLDSRLAAHRHVGAPADQTFADARSAGCDEFLPQFRVVMRDDLLCGEVGRLEVVWPSAGAILA